VEILENRLMLSTVRWTNSAGGDWDTASNWVNAVDPNDHHVPTSADDAQINLSGITVAHSSLANDSIRSLTCLATLSISGGSLSIADSSTTANLNLGGLFSGTLTGAGDITVTKALNWTGGGTMSGTGTTTVTPGATVNLSGQLFLDSRTLVNAGIATWTASSPNDGIRARNGATINNLSGAIFTMTNDGFFAEDFTTGAQPVFNNFGTFIKAGGTGVTGFQLFPLNNSGSMQVQSGTLALSYNGDSTGSFRVSAGATLQFGFGSGSGTNTQTLEGPSRISGAGTVVVNGGIVNIKGTYDLGNSGTTQAHFGEAHFTGPVASLGKVLTIDGGTADFSSGAPVIVPELDLTSGTLTGTDNVVVSGTLNWSNATMSGLGKTTVAASGQLNLSGSLHLWSRTLVNAGSATWSGDGSFDVIGMKDGATIDNLPGATFAVTNDRGFRTENIATPVVFNNAGTLVKTGGTGTTLFYFVAVNNTGVMRAEQGTFEIDGANLSIDGAGVLTAEPGTALVFSGGGDNASLTGQTRNASQFAPMPTVLFDPTFDPNSPQSLEVMSQDLGNTSEGFVRNFAYNALQVGDSNGLASVKLVDDARNSPGTHPEGLYVNTLVVTQLATLDLSGLHVYARSAQVDGTILHGSVSIVPPGGAIALNTSAPGKLATSGQVDDWTFYARTGQSIAVTLHTGAGGSPAPAEPALDWGEVTLLDPKNNQVATASNSQAGADASIPATVLQSDGVYDIHVQAQAGHAGSLGNYVLSIYGSPVHEYSLPLNQRVHGQLDTRVAVDRWQFSAPANEQVQFQLLAAANPGIQFDLTGPAGFTGFTDLTADSPPVTLPASGDYTLTARVAGAQPGAYAFELRTAPIALTLGTPFTESLAGSGQTQLFQLQLATASPLQVGLTDPQTSDENEVYVKFGAPPTIADYDYRFSTPAAPNQTVTIPQAAPGTWYILVYNPVVPASGSYTLIAVASSILLDHVSPAQLGTARENTLTLTGAGFDATTTVELVPATGAAHAAASVAVASPTSLTAMFRAGTVPPGVYSVRVARPTGGSSVLANAFTVVQGGQAHLETNLTVPSALAVHFIPATIEIEYSNTGTDAMPAPLLLLTATQGSHQAAFLTLDHSIVHSGIFNLAVPDGFTNSIQLLASGATPGLLQPGESIQVPVYWAGWLASEWDPSSPIIFHLSAVQADDSITIDWPALEDSLRPSTIAVAAWNAIYPNLVAQIGSTWGQYVARMDDDAAYLGSLGENVTDLSQLFEFEIQQANGFSPVDPLASAVDLAGPAPGLPLIVDRQFTDSITGRHQLGPFGRGWSWLDSWDQTVSASSDGTVVVASGDGSQRRYQPDSRGGYFDEPGDDVTLRKLASGVYTVTEPNGLVTAFRADGKVDYVQDTNGNRITVGYTNGLLTSLTHSSGQSLQIAYNSGGLIKAITDPATDRTTTYAYDATNEHLITVTTFDNRTTTYSYDLGTNPASANALLSVAHPDDTHEFFVYDLQGRLKETHRDGGAEQITYTYGPGGAVTATDAAGGKTTDFYDDMGMIAEVEDALHRVTHFAFDMDLNLTQVTDAAGQSYHYAYDGKDNLVRATDPLGHSVSFGYAGPFKRLTSSTDQNGNTTLYGYDPNGNAISTTYADGSVERVTYDALGDPKTLTNRRGDAVTYQYDSSVRLTSEVFADSTQMTYHYDGRGNLTSTTDASGTTTLVYDSIDQLKEIDYPGGLFLKYRYDVAGRRTQMADQTGFTVNYTYDSVGRLAKLADGNDALIDQYTYYDDGRLKREDKGKGTFTTYEYDLAGDLLHLVNHAPDGTVNSRFDYTYDVLGRRATETTLDGEWTYTYDAIGELTHAVLASNNPSAISNQDLQYFYDAAGNRTQTIINGVTTTYLSNNLNQYTSIGTEHLSYDADGNLVSRTDGATTSTYRYDDENRLISAVTPAGTFASQYDALGFRIATDFNGGRTRYVIDPTGLGNVVGVYDASGGVIAHYTHGAGLISRVDVTGAASYYDFDAIGSTAGLTGSTGHYEDVYRYLPYGGLVTSSETIANPFQFVAQAGVMTDPSGLDLMRARFYSSADGRFLSEDPLGLAGGQSNLYEYVRNNSVAYIDPSGLCLKRRYVDRAVFLLEENIELLQASRAEDVAELEKRPSPQDAAFLEESIRYITQLIQEEQETIKILKKLKCKPKPKPKKPPVPPECRSQPSGAPPPGAGKPSRHAVKESLAAGAVPMVDPADPSDPCPDRMSQPVRSFDPNDKIGPGGYGPAGFIAPGGALPYRIDFENEATASAPAQRVVVTDQLDPNFDWKTFALTGVGFGDTDIAIPPGSQHFQTSVDITENSQPVEVDIELGLNPQTGLVTATFQSIDPSTQLPPDVLTGFLPPENGTGRGKGYFTYIIQPKAGLPTGTQIRNVAAVVFDANAPITTDQKDDHDPSKGVDPAKQDLITIDAGAPSSHVAPLPAKETSSNFTVSWSGRDDSGGSGVASYDVYVSDNGGPFVAFLAETTRTSATFHGVNGHTYAFFSVATDNVGNVQATPATAQASTKVVVSTPTGSPLVGPIATPLHAVRAGASAAVRASFSEVPANRPHTAAWSWGDGKASDGKVTESKGSGSGTVTGSHIYANPGLYRVTLTVTDAHKRSGKSAAAQYIVVYNPTAGSLTGNGTITSPAGAVPTNPKLTGKATFQLSATYAANSTMPSGRLVFTFQPANLSFQTTSLDWLVVSGGTAWYQGTGTVNGTGSFRFLVAAQSGGHGTGKLRIRIWNKATGAILYDSQPGAPIQAAPTTITGGSIVLQLPNPRKIKTALDWLDRSGR
jgi:RHS repeat-associated protein